MFRSVPNDYLIFETIITYAPGISHQYTIICSISTVDQIHMNAKWRTNYAQKSQFVVRSLIKKRENKRIRLEWYLSPYISQTIVSVFGFYLLLTVLFATRQK
mmetsp:Transcript_39065/g.94478  ORF Transcript_39065/g.94478 Transcript_39065/m.94478 type:complete len:102 (-) Transcript_39065:1687-1992(-)